MTQGYRIRKDADGSTSVEQHEINGWTITWNPDDRRFYVSRGTDGVATATFSRWSNAVYYAKNH